MTFGDGSSSEYVQVGLVSLNFFAALDVQAVQGRVFTSQDRSSGSVPAILTYSFWQRHFSGDPTVVGRKILLQGHPFVVLGVLPRNFNGLTADRAPDIRIPLDAGLLLQPPSAKPKTQLGQWVSVEIVGCVRPGTALAQAQSEVATLVKSLLRTYYRGVNDGAAALIDQERQVLEPIPNGISVLRGTLSQGLLLLSVGAGLFLLMACANVAGLLLANAAARQPEIGVRLALGASTSRLVRQMLTEASVLALIGGAGGLILSAACMRALLLFPPSLHNRSASLIRLTIHLAPNWRTLGFAFAATSVCLLLFAVAPAAWAVRQRRLITVHGHRRGTARHLLVTVQVALCTLLVLGSGLLVRTLHHLQNLDPGFDKKHVATFTLNPEIKGYSEGDSSRSLHMRLVEMVGSLPGVESVAVASRGLMRGTGMKTSAAAAGSRVTLAHAMNTSLNNVTPEYFTTMGMRLLAGRNFVPSDHGVKPTRVIVNETLGRRIFPGVNPVGMRFGSRIMVNEIADPDYEIIGVVSDARYRSLREEVHPTFYSLGAPGDFAYIMVLHVKTKQDPASLFQPVREIMHALDPELPFSEVHALAEEVDASLWQERLLAALASAFGALATVLAATGLYALLNYLVRARTREIGIRMALGAAPARIVNLVSFHALVMVLPGVVAGLAAYWASARWMRHLLYGVQPADPAVLVFAVVLVLGIGVLATSPAAWRAVRIDPAKALSQDR